MILLLSLILNASLAFALWLRRFLPLTAADTERLARLALDESNRIGQAQGRIPVGWADIAPNNRAVYLAVAHEVGTAARRR